MDSMSFYANRALRNTEGIANDSIRRILASSSYNLLGLSSNNQGLFEASKKFHLQGLEIIGKQKKGYPYYSNLHGLANIYMKLEDFTNAIKYYIEMYAENYSLFSAISIKTSKGFKIIQKHIKIEPQRWYYWEDKLGLLVCQDLPVT